MRAPLLLAMGAMAVAPPDAKVTVSGVSSGGFFAVQFHVAFSSLISGAGVIAGGPFYCAQGNVDVALSSCMTTPELISVEELAAITRNTYITTKTIDDPANLAKNNRVWLFTGTKDTVVHPGVVRKLESYYGLFGIKHIKMLDTIPAEHSWVTDSFGNACAFKGEPYMNQCGFDAASELLSFLYPTNTRSNLASNRTQNRLNTTATTGRLMEINQARFVPGGAPPAPLGLGKTAYAWVPEGCENGCHVHVAFHGCLQSLKHIGMDFVNHTGLNEYADANSIVILYPQATTTVLNPKGCWDWWGYAGPGYASQLGVQMATVKAMLDSVMTGELF